MTNIKDLQNMNQSTGRSFPRMLEQFKGEIIRALPPHLNGDRMARIALTAFRLNPKLGQCDPEAVFAAVIQSSQLGLEPNIRGRSFILPFGKKCQFFPGWQGLVELMNRSGQASIWTQAVFAGDEFDYAYGDSPFVHHRPGVETDPERITHAYAVGARKNIETKVIEVWSVEKIRAHRDRYNKVGRQHYSYDNWEMYCRKVVLLQVLKYLPSSVELDTAIALNDAAEVGKQHLTMKEAIEGTWAPSADDDADDEGSDIDPQNENESGWPKKVIDQETGEENWMDNSDPPQFFDHDKHAMGPNGTPSMRRDGTFRARSLRGSKKAQTKPGRPRKTREQIEERKMNVQENEPAPQTRGEDTDQGFGEWE